MVKTLGVALVSFALLAPAAEAATIERGGQYGQDVVYKAGDGEVNDLTVDWGDGTITVTDPGASAIGFPSSSCHQGADAHTVVCNTAATLHGGGITIARLGDQNDHVRIVNGRGAWLEGGPGDDLLEGTTSSDSFLGGDGHDTYVSNGGAEDDVNYRTDSGPVHIDLEDQSGNSDGEVIPANINWIIGSEYDDTIAGTDAADNLSGGRGNDTITGRGGDDKLYGALWNDSRNGRNDRDGDTLDGGDGDDELIGDGGDDALHGGAGDDYLQGAYGGDDMHGGAGFDIATYVEHHDCCSWPEPPGIAITIGGTNPEGDTLAPDVEGLIGTGYADTITGDDGPNVIAAAGTVDGRGGDDVLMGSGHVTGGPGNDVISTDGFAPDSRADGGLGDDVIALNGLSPRAVGLGGDGNDALYNLSPVHSLDAGRGDDLIIGGYGGYDSGGTCGAGDDLLTVVADSRSHGFDECERNRTSAFGDNRVIAVLARAGDRVLGSTGPTNVTTPHAGAIVVEQRGWADDPALLQRTIIVKAPATTADRPLDFEFAVPTDVVYADGVRLPACGSTVPCVGTRDGDYVHVLATDGGVFTFGAPEPGSRGAAPDPQAGGGGGGTILDRIAPTVRIAKLGAPRLTTVKKKGLRIPLRCSERCRTTVEIRLKRKLVGKGTVTLKSTGSATVRIARRYLRKPVKLTVTANALDAAGNKARQTSKTVKLR